MTGPHFRDQDAAHGSAWSRIDRIAGHFVAHLDLGLKLFSASLSPPSRAVVQLNLDEAASHALTARRYRTCSRLGHQSHEGARVQGGPDRSVAVRDP